MSAHPHAYPRIPTYTHGRAGIGRMSLLHALKELGRLTRSTTYPANVNSIVVAGHSMGGHGAWLLAVLRPDQVRAVNPNAGWIRKEHYGDSNTLFLFDYGQ